MEKVNPQKRQKINISCFEELCIFSGRLGFKLSQKTAILLYKRVKQKINTGTV
jgi:hypothetical protein